MKIRDPQTNRLKNNIPDGVVLFQGSYERALQYFGIDLNLTVEEDAKDGTLFGAGDLLKLVMYHQTNEHATPKLTNELYDILMAAQCEKHYWAAPQQREARTYETLQKAQSLGLLQDEQILKVLHGSSRDGARQRIRKFRAWEEMQKFK